MRDTTELGVKVDEFQTGYDMGRMRSLVCLLMRLSSLLISCQPRSTKRLAPWGFTFSAWMGEITPAVGFGEAVDVFRLLAADHGTRRMFRHHPSLDSSKSTGRFQK